MMIYVSYISDLMTVTFDDGDSVDLDVDDISSI